MRTALGTFDCRKALIGLGKYHAFAFAGVRTNLPLESETATDLDRIINVRLIASSTSATSFALRLKSNSTAASILPPSRLFLVFDLKIDQNDEALALLPDEEQSSPESATNRDLDRRNGIAARERERRKAGSPSMRLERRPTDPREARSAEEKREKEDEEEEEEEVVVVVAQQLQGRTWAQSGQRVTRRSRRQRGQIPILRRLEGCFGHFHTSSSSP